mmetsp:Transcript_3156/g.5951  ORF Transcript_3156/g.5951 Transcript_3156/m.5951 type:complete len:91 (+) Transcript_3156:273-545(+)
MNTFLPKNKIIPIFTFKNTYLHVPALFPPVWQPRQQLPCPGRGQSEPFSLHAATGWSVGAKLGRFVGEEAGDRVGKFVGYLKNEVKKKKM